MPFTFSHPAAVLPFRKLEEKGLSVSAMITGSLTPDFEYFIRFRFYGKFSHSLAGIFWFDLPCAIVLLYVFHYIVRNSVLVHLPASVSGRFQTLRNLNWNRYFVRNHYRVLLAALFGIITHLVWDSFTHKDGFMVLQMPFLNRDILPYDGRLPVFKILQHGSSLVGAILIIRTIYKLPIHDFPHTDMKSVILYWSGIVVVTGFILIFRLMTGLKWVQPNSILITVISGFILSLIILGIPGFMRQIFRS